MSVYISGNSQILKGFYAAIPLALNVSGSAKALALVSRPPSSDFTHLCCLPKPSQLHVLENATSNTGKTSTELKTFSSSFCQICRLFKNHISWATGIGLALAVNMAGPGPSLAFFSIHTRFLGEPTWSVALNIHCRNSLVVQWLRLCAPNAGDLGSIPGQGTRSHTLQER